LVGSFTLFSMRSHLVAGAPRLGSLVSREGTFLANNLILSVYAFVVLIGTIYPLVLEAFTGTRVGVGGPFFNRLAVPLSFLLLLVMGLGPITPWGQAPTGLVWRRARIPGLVALVAGLLTALTVTRVGWVVLAVVLGVFVVSALVGLLVEQAGRRMARGEGLRRAVGKVVGGDQAFWAGQLSHVGVVLVVLGIAFAANLGDHLEVEMAPGDSVEFAGFTLTFDAPFQREAPGKTTRGARLDVVDPGGRQVVMEPAVNYFGADTTGVGTPDVLTRAGGDLYVTLLALSPERATLTLDTSPMIWLLWIGGLTVAGGGLWSVLARKRERHMARERQTADV
jgi:cytochrome c-type biogenesis protein CcmF